MFNKILDFESFFADSGGMRNTPYPLWKHILSFDKFLQIRRFDATLLIQKIFKEILNFENFWQLVGAGYPSTPADDIVYDFKILCIFRVLTRMYKFKFLSYEIEDLQNFWLLVVRGSLFSHLKT